jgi:hypothetical protein
MVDRFVESQKGYLTLPVSGPVELNSYDNTCCADLTCAVLEFTNKSCNVIGYNRDNPKMSRLPFQVLKLPSFMTYPLRNSY